MVAPSSASAAHASETRSTARPRPSSASKVASTSAGSSAASPAGVTRNDGSATSGASGPSASIAGRGPTSVATRHHGALPVVVDRGVGHLGEPLAEVGRERACTPGERRDRRVVAHRVDGVAPALRDRAEHEAQLLARVAVQRVARDELGLGRRDPVARLAEADALGHPGRVGPARRELSRELGVEAQAALGVDREELARPETCAPDADALGQRNGARLGGDRDEPVVADRDTERAESVPVELRTADDAIREDEPRRPVPRLDGHGVIAAHRALLLVDARVVLPGWWHQPRECLLDVEARADEELDGVVEEGRVRAPVVERRRESGVEPASPLARLHPRDVPVDRVDLAVVAEHAERLRALPARLGVRREALVEDRERRRPLRVVEVGIEAGELRRSAERLVGDGAEGERGDVDAVDELRAPAGAVGTLLGVLLVARREHELRDAGHRGDRSGPERGHVDRNVAPAERLEPFCTTGFLDDSPEPRLAQEAHRDTGAIDPGQRPVERQEHAGAVARDAVGGPGTAVRDGGEPRERAIDELARRAPTRVGDEADAAGVAFEGHAVEERRGSQDLPPFPVEWTYVETSLPPCVCQLVRRRREKSPASARAGR